MTVSGFNKFGVPFYGFNQQWGEWNRCDENGNIVNGGNLYDDDPVKIVGTDTITQKEDTTGGTVYLKWKITDPNAKPKTGDHLEGGQDLINSDIETPMVTIEVLNSTMDDPAVYASGSYSGFWKKQINLNTALTSEVTDVSRGTAQVAEPRAGKPRHHCGRGDWQRRVHEAWHISRPPVYL